MRSALRSAVDFLELFRRGFDRLGGELVGVPAAGVLLGDASSADAPGPAASLVGDAVVGGPVAAVFAVELSVEEVSGPGGVSGTGGSDGEGSAGAISGAGDASTEEASEAASELPGPY